MYGNGMMGVQGAGVTVNSAGYPIRPGVTVCSFYARTQTCKFGATCQFTHPEGGDASITQVQVGFRSEAPPADGFNSKGFPIRHGAGICTFFAKTGDCKYGATCQFSHPEGDANELQIHVQNSTAPADGYNSKGYPIRIGVQMCTFFSNTGDCKFSKTCKFDHTEGADAVVNGGSSMSNSLGNPIRPGQTPCSFFIKTGTCSYGATCKFDHPEDYTQLANGAAPPPPRAAGPTPMAAGFNSQGYPTRPGQLPCQFFVKNGTCNYGTTCKWDHPEGLAGAQLGGGRVMGRPGVPFVARAMPY